MPRGQQLLVREKPREAERTAPRAELDLSLCERPRLAREIADILVDQYFALHSVQTLAMQLHLREPWSRLPMAQLEQAVAEALRQMRLRVVDEGKAARAARTVPAFLTRRYGRATAVIPSLMTCRVIEGLRET